MRNFLCSIALIASVVAFSEQAAAQTQPKPATEATKAANEAVLKSLPFGDKSDFEDAERGLIARPEHLTIKNDKGTVVWDLEKYKTFIGDDKTRSRHGQSELVAQCPTQHALRLSSAGL